MDLDTLLREAVSHKASDIHVSVGLPPVIRIDGHLIPVNHPPLTREEVQHLIFTMLSPEQRRHLEQNWDLDCSYGQTGVGRFRVNVYKDKGNYAMALRTINSRVPSFEDLGLPEVVKQTAQRPRGLVLVTGPTGSGKSTTLAAMIDYINTTQAHHILTIEDPIEFIHTSKKSIIHQRELGQDTKSFENALRGALREDPDIILVGEMRDLETIRLAITAAETGHLVMGTLHTSSAIQTVDRMIDVFPADQQDQIRAQLSNCLAGIFSQVLLPRVNAKKEIVGRVLAQEILINTPAIANLLREGKTAQLYSSIQTGTQMGMTTLEMSLKFLYNEGLITLDEALKKTSRTDELKRLIASGR